MSNFQLQLENELRAVCACWGLPRIGVSELPRKTPLPGAPVEGEENVSLLGEVQMDRGPMPVFHSTDPRDVLGNANWARGWCSCLTHPENGLWEGKWKRATQGHSFEGEQARFDDGRAMALWAARCVGASLLFT